MVVRRADVAKLAGTSPAVVSYVLNGGPRTVSADTRARMLAAIEQLGYQPNGIARSLAIVAFDGIAAAAYATPAITTMAQPFALMAQAAVVRRLAQIDGVRDPQDEVLPVHLVARGSCGCPDPPGGGGGGGEPADPPDTISGP